MVSLIDCTLMEDPEGTDDEGKYLVVSLLEYSKSLKYVCDYCIMYYP